MIDDRVISTVEFVDLNNVITTLWRRAMSSSSVSSCTDEEDPEDVETKHTGWRYSTSIIVTPIITTYIINVIISTVCLHVEGLRLDKSK